MSASQATPAPQDSAPKPVRENVLAQGVVRLFPLEGLQPILLMCALGVFALGVWRYDFLIDDAFISFRYARHFAEGLGLVWNPGEFVEGYTNFLWVVLLAAGMLLGLEPEVLSPALGILSGLGILLGLFSFASRRFPRTCLLPGYLVLVLAVNRSFCAWSTSGLETQLFSLLVLLATLELSEKPHRGAVGLGSCLFGLATLARPEGALFFSIAWWFFYGCPLIRSWRVQKSWRVPALADATQSALAYLAIVLPHFLWRLFYYGYPLPNTFYVKVSGLWLSQSTQYLHLFFLDYSLYYLLPFCFLGFLIGGRLERLFGAYLLMFFSYLIYIGGDAFEYRFLVPVFPYLDWLILFGSWKLSTRLFTSVFWRQTAFMACFVWIFLGRLESLEPHTGLSRAKIANLAELQHYTAIRIEEGRFLKRLVTEGFLSPDLRIAVTGAGALPYYSELFTVDILGLNDLWVAHQPLTARGAIGHEKRATAEYLDKRGVALIDDRHRLVFHASAREAQPDHRFKERPGKARLRRVRALGKVLIFHSSLSEDEFKQTFSRFEILPPKP